MQDILEFANRRRVEGAKQLAEYARGKTITTDAGDVEVQITLSDTAKFLRGFSFLRTTPNQRISIWVNNDVVVSDLPTDFLNPQNNDNIFVPFFRQVGGGTTINFRVSDNAQNNLDIAIYYYAELGVTY